MKVKICFFILLGLGGVGFQGHSAEKLKPETVVVKHLESLAPPEVRAKIQSRLMAGTVLANFRLGGSGQIQGEARLAFQGPKSLIAMLFGALDYPHEKIAYNGVDLTVANISPGVRSQLCQFLYVHPELFKAGLITGALSPGWALLDPSYRNARLQYSGLRKIDNRPVHELKFRPNKGTDFTISLFFEDGTFRHVRSVYSLTVSAMMGARPEDSAQLRETRNRLVEDFSDFQPEGRWMLPHQYKLQLSMEGQARTILFDWALVLSRFIFDVPLQDTDFNVAN